MTSCNDSGAAQHAISIPQGSDWSEDYQLVDPDGLPVDCTGWAGEAILRLSATESYNFTVTTLDALLGEYRVSMDDSVTSTLRKGVFKWQFNLVDGSDGDLRWIEGSATVTTDLRDA